MQLLTKFIDSKEGLTMIRAQVKTSNGWQNKYFVIDTGATISLFSPEVCKTRKICDSIMDMSGNILVSQRCTAILSLAEKDMSIEGHVVDYEIFPKIARKQVSGLLGVDFLRKKSMVELNYKDRANASKERQGACLMSVCVLKTTCF